MASTGTHGLKFSIVITLYNKAPFIKRTLLSVLRQSKPAYEIIVVDDNSSDDSYKIVESVKNNEAREHPSRIKLIRRSQNGGPGAARNTGLEQVSGDYIFLLDGDDEYKPGLFARAEQIFLPTNPACCSYSLSRTPTGVNYPTLKNFQTY
ncbi:MAG: glycosyltransferase family 2 protein [Reinekea sp.]